MFGKIIQKKWKNSLDVLINNKYDYFYDRTKTKTKPEIKMEEILKQNNTHYKFVGHGEIMIGRKCPDFVDENQKKIIEIYEDYWHKGQNPQDKIDYYKNFGWKCLIIWEHELKSKRQLLIQKIINFSGGE